MELVKKYWKIYKNKKAKIKKENGKIIITNDTDKNAMLYCVKLFKKKNDDIQVTFKGKIIKGEAAVFEFINRNREILAETTINSKMFFTRKDVKYFFAVIKVFPHTSLEVDTIDFESKDTTSEDMYEDFTNDTLVITPSYPSEEHKYLSGFVHSRIMGYKSQGINVDVAVVYDYLNMSKYTFEGINVTRMSYLELRNLLCLKKYKRILIHFMDEKYFSVISGADLIDTELFVWVHGPETLYWDFPKFVTRYFEQPYKLTETDINIFKNKDKIIKSLNEMPNVKFIFVSNWIKKRSEELIKIEFNNYEVIPNIIDIDLFDFKKKTKDKMKKIFMLRRYDDIDKYAVDVSVRTILELSKRPGFDEYEFNIYGNGCVWDKLFKPLLNFKNVHFYRSFYTHEQISQIHKENGIALFPTRYDAQGVSMCEAGSSGLLVVSSDNDAIKEFIPSKDGNIIDTEEYVKYADFIEKVSNDPKLFQKICDDTRKKIEEKCSYDATIKKEINLLKKKASSSLYNFEIPNLAKNPVLSIVIPSYNVEKYVLRTIESLIIGNKNANKVEIIVVNDGSKDNTANIVRDFINKYGKNAKNPSVILVDKENGGHGSTINVGIAKATGKYFRIIDGDDWVDTKDFEKLISILEKEDSDIVCTNYSEDLYYGKTCVLLKKYLYSNLREGFKYNFDDLCHQNYGFNSWGPILATANIKLDLLREANFKLSEKTFYVDMEYNTYYLPYVNTFTYYDLDVYRYFIGRSDQSISNASFIRNIDQHQKVINNILVYTESKVDNPNKKDYLYRNIINPMVIAHYNLVINTIKKRKKFVSFDKMIQKNINKDYDNYGSRVRILRKTRGHFIKFLSFVFEKRGH